ncbi:MAG: hypothetical protein M3O34_20415, partial [Chloroflexota bacterium]|nr:hypothetical protein [Chloroflexota bacterium]
VTGEVVIDRERVTERETVGDTVRRERVTVDEDYDEDGPAVTQRSGAPRMDEATSDRTLETTRPGVRRAETAHEAGDAESWEHLRKDIRDASERTRR